MDDETQATGAQNVPADTTAADTTAPQPSEASAQAETQTPEATQGAEENQSPEVKAEDTVEGKLYAGKYKSVEEMERGYQELQSKATRDSQEKAELVRALTESFTPPQAEAQAPYEAAPYVDDFEQPDPVQTELQDVKSRLAIQTFIMLHQDANPAEMKKILEQDPNAQQIPSHDARLEYAYLKSKNMAAPAAIEEAQQKAAQQAEVKVAEKQAAKVEAAAKTSVPADDRADLLKRMKYGDKAAREKIISSIPGVQAMRKQAGLE